ncbi:MAG: hypothetical protein Q9218_005461 [Villophora microphyllina]
MSNPLMGLQHGKPSSATAPSISSNGAVIVGLYGLSGCGKTTMLEQLKLFLGEEHFTFYEGSAFIGKLMPNGLEAFKQLPGEEKTLWREHAIKMIQMECVQNGKVGVVTGHFTFWSEDQQEATSPVWTKEESNAYTHVIYLDIPPIDIYQRRQKDNIKGTRTREDVSVEQLQDWQLAEKSKLFQLCRGHGILFAALPNPDSTRVSQLLEDFRCHNEVYNLIHAKGLLDAVVAPYQKQVKIMLVMDADRTLAAEDTGELFWKSKGKAETLREMFGSSLQYSYIAFRQATLLYEHAATDQEFGALCQEVAKKVAMYPAMLDLLKRAANETHVGVVIFTCGLRGVWEEVLKREGFRDTVKVVGGGRIANGLVITPSVKGALITHLRDIHSLYVWAFGDSPMDLEMLGNANKAVVVVGDEQTRSKTMDEHLSIAIETGGLRAQQALMSGYAKPRLDTVKLPLCHLMDKWILKETIFIQRTTPEVLQMTDKKAAKLLATSMRNADVAGPALREAHARAGNYLAIEYLTDLVGLEEISITHVLGQRETGYRLRGEKTTTIVALMRGGEPMASGVSAALPLAMLVHANNPEDVKDHHLEIRGEKRSTIILVDSVVNTGKTVLQFVKHIRKFDAAIRIIVVAGVVQADFVSGKRFAEEEARKLDFTLVTLRVSKTKFTGSGNYDTGNRLFNTTHLEKKEKE